MMFPRSLLPKQEEQSDKFFSLELFEFLFLELGLVCFINPMSDLSTQIKLPKESWTQLLKGETFSTTCQVRSTEGTQFRKTNNSSFYDFKTKHQINLSKRSRTSYSKVKFFSLGQIKLSINQKHNQNPQFRKYTRTMFSQNHIHKSLIQQNPAHIFSGIQDEFTSSRSSRKSSLNRQRERLISKTTENQRRRWRDRRIDGEDGEIEDSTEIEEKNRGRREKRVFREERERERHEPSN